MIDSSTVPSWWPHRAASQWVTVGTMRWHVQSFGGESVDAGSTDAAKDAEARGDAPVALLLHGTGASSHSWRQLAPLLARQHFHVIAPDLPGHAFTQTPATQSLALPAVAAALDQLLKTLRLKPTLIIGHSAGAAIALRMALDGHVAPRLIASINGAILPLQGPVGRLFMPLAKVMAANSLVPPAFAACTALPWVTKRLLDSTGSRIDKPGERCYAHLVRNPQHVAGALRLMASWDLQPLALDLPKLRTQVLLISGGNDRTLPPAYATRVASLIRTNAGCVTMPKLGHLAHEEDPMSVTHAVTTAWEEKTSKTNAAFQGGAAPCEHRASVA